MVRLKKGSVVKDWAFFRGNPDWYRQGMAGYTTLLHIPPRGSHILRASSFAARLTDFGHSVAAALLYPRTALAFALPDTSGRGTQREGPSATRNAELMVGMLQEAPLIRCLITRHEMSERLWSHLTPLRLRV